MKAVRVCLATGLILIGLVLFPVSISFGDLKVTDTIRQAQVTACTNAFNLCTAQCSALASSAPGAYAGCMQDCAQKYSRCMGAIARRAPKGEHGAASPLPVAPPKPTPGKISPKRVGGVSTTKAAPTVSHKSASTPTPVSRLRSGKASATPTPKPAKK